MNNLTTLKALSCLCFTLTFLASCSNSSFPLTADRQANYKKLVYQGTYQPSLDQKMRLKMLESLEAGKRKEANQFSGLIGFSQAVKVKVSREVPAGQYTPTDKVIAFEGGQSKELVKDKVNFDDLLLNTRESRYGTYSYQTVPLDKITVYKDLDRQWEVLGSAGSKNIAGRQVSLTKVRLVRKIDDYRRAVSHFTLSNDLPGRVASYEKVITQKGKSTPVIKLKLHSLN